MPAYPIGPAITEAGATKNLTLNRFAERVNTSNALGASHVITAGSTSSSITVAETCSKVRLHGQSHPCAFRAGVGAQTAVATDHFVAAGQTLEAIVPPGATIAAIRTGGSNASLYISELL
jgi:hypothetical protein